MARPFYPYEADDPDLDWLISNFLYERPDYLPVDSGMLPLIMIPYQEDAEEMSFDPDNEDLEDAFSAQDE